MKILGFLIFLFAVPVLAQPVVVNCASTTLATTYSTSPPSLPTAFTLIQPPPQGHLMISNPTSVAICATATVSATAPSTLTPTEHCVPPNAIAAWDDLNFPSNSKFYIYLRADQSSCTTGILYVDFW